MPDLTDENKVMVNILGEEYPVTGVSDPSYISKVADLVDSRMRDASKSTQVSGRDKIAILAAMSIASELKDTSTQLQLVEDQLDQQLDVMLQRLDHAIGDDSGGQG